MAAIDNLNTNVADLTAKVAAVADEVHALQAAAAATGVPEVQVQAAADAVAAQTAALAALLPAPTV